MRTVYTIVFCASALTAVHKTMTWTNWAGNQTCQPTSIFYPTTKDELSAIIKKAAFAQKTIRVVGAGHSWSSIVCTNAVMIDLKNLSKVISVDKKNNQVTVQAGITLEKLNPILAKHGLALANQPAVMHMTLGGLTATGTHGSGKTGSLSSFIVGAELITADGALHTLSATSDPEALAAVRVSLGALGVVYSLTLQCLPQFTLHACSYTTSKENFLQEYSTLYKDNEYVQFLWNLTNDTVRVYTRNKELNKSHNNKNQHCSNARTSYNVLSSLNAGGKRLEEEIAISSKDLPQALADIQKVTQQFAAKGLLIQELLIRFVQADTSALLSMAADRDTCFLSISTPVDSRYMPFYQAFEQAMLKYKGRPHWGKINFVTKTGAQQLYGANFDRFVKIKNRFDPHNIFSNSFTNQLFE